VFFRDKLARMRFSTAIALCGALASVSPARGDAPATLAIDQAARGTMAVCSDGKQHFIAIAREELGDGSSLFFGDGHKFQQLPKRGWGVPPGWFFDPRFFNAHNNDNLRGIDLRVFSHVDYRAEKKTCEITCGDRTTPLKVLDGEEAMSLTTKADFVAAAAPFKPYALARDTTGVYYYVDRGSTPSTEKQFRLYRGQKGAMKLLKMTNVVSDSEGDIFSTKTGSLRLILDKRQSNWIEGKTTTALTLVPVEKNFAMIYNDLGVYTGQRLGTPCDDL
jgi:hypothetical protein